MKTPTTTGKWLLRLALAAALVVALTGCGMGGDSPQDIVRTFVSYINSGNYSGIQGLTDSSANNYNTANTASFWDAEFPASGRTYTISSISGDSTVTATITASNSTSGTYTFTFSGSEGNLFTPSDYKIRTIKEGSTTIFE